MNDYEPDKIPAQDAAQREPVPENQPAPPADTAAPAVSTYPAPSANLALSAPRPVTTADRILLPLTLLLGYLMVESGAGGLGFFLFTLSGAAIFAWYAGVKNIFYRASRG